MAERATRARTAHDLIGDEYDVVALRLRWGGLSVAFFLASLLSPYLLRLQPWRPEELWRWPLVKVLAVAATALVGLVAGLVGVRYSPARGLARTGVFLNGVVVACIFLVILGMFAILRYR